MRKPAVGFFPIGAGPSDKSSHGARNGTMVVLIVVLVIAMALLVSVIVRLRIDRVPAALEAFEATRTQLQGVDAAVRSIKAGHNAVVLSGDATLPLDLGKFAVAAGRHLDKLVEAPCGDRAAQLAHRTRISDLRQNIGKYIVVGSGPFAPGGEALLAQIQSDLLGVDRSAHECFRVEIDNIWEQAVSTKQRVEVLLLLIVFTVIALLLMRRNDLAHARDQARFNEQLIDALPLPLSVRSPDLEFMLVNRAFEERHNVRRADVLGKPVSASLPKSDADAIAGMDSRAAGSDGHVEAEFHHVGPGPERHVLVRVLALRREDGQIAGTVGIQSDVSAMHRKEAQLVEINSKLSQLSIKMIDAQEDERRRIARDLHDQVGQILTALKLQLASLARRERIDLPAVALVAPIDLAEEALRHTRDLSASLHPHLLDDLGLEAALNWLIDRFIRPSVPYIELRCRLEPARGPDAIELVAFRVVQEALTNVVRHAGATRAGVMLETHEGELTIEVIDDGVGFDAGLSWFDLQRSTSLGVTSMRDRVTEIGGELHMDSHPGSGTSLRVRLPWNV